MALSERGARFSEAGMRGGILITKKFTLLETTVFLNIIGVDNAWIRFEGLSFGAALELNIPRSRVGVAVEKQS